MISVDQPIGIGQNIAQKASFNFHRCTSRYQIDALKDLNTTVRVSLWGVSLEGIPPGCKTLGPAMEGGGRCLDPSHNPVLGGEHQAGGGGYGGGNPAPAMHRW